MMMYYRHTDVAPDHHLVEPLLSHSTVSNPAGTPKQAGHQVREVELSGIALTSSRASSSRSYEAFTVKDHPAPFTLAPAPAISATETSLRWTTLRVRSESSPVVFALGVSSIAVTLGNEVSSSQRVAEIPLSTAHASTGSTIQPSISSATSEPTPAQSASESPVNTGSARRTGIIIGSVLGGSAALLMIGLAFVYVAWRRRSRTRDVAAREDLTQRRLSKDGKGAGNTTKERRRSTTESPVPLPLQGATAAPRTLRSEPIIVDTISPMTPITPHLSRWTSEKADIPSPAGHPAIDIPPHLRHHPLFAGRHHDRNDDDEDEDEPGPDEHAGGHPDDVSPVSSISASPSPSPPAVAAALGSFLFFDSPSSRSSRRPSTRDSSAPRTALSMPPPPRRRHTRAGAGHSVRRGSGSSVVGGGGVESSPRPPTPPPPPLPTRSAARSKSLHDVERPAVWI